MQNLIVSITKLESTRHSRTQHNSSILTEENTNLENSIKYLDLDYIYFISRKSHTCIEIKRIWVQLETNNFQAHSFQWSIIMHCNTFWEMFTEELKKACATEE